MATRWQGVVACVARDASHRAACKQLREEMGFTMQEAAQVVQRGPSTHGNCNEMTLKRAHLTSKEPCVLLLEA